MPLEGTALRVSPEANDRVTREAKRRGLSVYALAREIIEEWSSRHRA